MAYDVTLDEKSAFKASAVWSKVQLLLRLTGLTSLLAKLFLVNENSWESAWHPNSLPGTYMKLKHRETTTPPQSLHQEELHEADHTVTSNAKFIVGCK